jgi:hypothetical protein
LRNHANCSAIPINRCRKVACKPGMPDELLRSIGPPWVSYQGECSFPAGGARPLIAGDRDRRDKPKTPRVADCASGGVTMPCPIMTRCTFSARKPRPTRRTASSRPAAKPSTVVKSLERKHMRKPYPEHSGRVGRHPRIRDWPNSRLSTVELRVLRQVRLLGDDCGVFIGVLPRGVESSIALRGRRLCAFLLKVRRYFDIEKASSRLIQLRIPSR